ncbi:hypothetical protein PAEPH01_0174 [Pancytospora epiphaga]|nr:hypothetical protein PAEPH01_0174 [Pancytospora epiphaga]
MTKSYMFSDRNAGSQRRRREDQQVELRRQRTEELLNKKRASSCNKESGTSFDSLLERLNSGDLETVYKGTFECRSSLSVEGTPPIQEVIDAGIIPRIVQLLNPATYSVFPETSITFITKTRIEAAWIITNIASGTNEQTMYLTQQGVIPELVSMLDEEDDAVTDQSVWALGNMAGDCEDIRDIILNHGALYKILALVDKYKVAKEHIRILRNLTWLMANLCRGRNPSPPQEVLEVVEGAVEKLVMLNDAEVVADCFWCLSYVVDVGDHLAKIVLESAILRRCYDLLSNFAVMLNETENPGVTYDINAAKIGAFSICPIIRMLGNIITGTDEATDVVIRAGFLNFMSTIFYRYDNKKLPRIRKEICWMLSNVSAGTSEQILSILSSDLANLLIDAISRYELYVRKEASYAILNLLHFCSKNPEHLQPLLDNQVIQAIQLHLSAITNVPDLQGQALDAVRYALEAGEKIRAKFGENPVVRIMIESHIVDDIEELQDVSSRFVNQKAYNIIMDYFEGEEQ